MRIDRPPHIVFAGGGTGGHLFPGLAVAEQLVDDSPYTRITFVGPGKPFERQLVAAAGFDYLQLPCRPLPQRPTQVLPFLLDNLSGYRAASRFLRWQRVAVVVGLGGYASVPMAQAAARSNVPLVLLEQNAVPGRATRWLARSATLVCTAFEQTRRHLHRRCPSRVTGTPIRAGFTHRLAALPAISPGTAGPPLPTPHWNPHHAVKPHKQLLVLGGSSGARTLNENVPRALYKIASWLKGWRIVHQSGRPGCESTRRLYQRLGLDATVVPFVVDMPRMMVQSDLAVCRAGGTTLAELAAAGLPAILLPYPYATDNHQSTNAHIFTTSGACLALDEWALSDRLDNHLARAISQLVSNTPKRSAMAAAIHQLAQPDATWDVATLIRHLTAATNH